MDVTSAHSDSWGACGARQLVTPPRSFPLPGSVTQGGRVMVIGAHAYLTLLVPGCVLQPYTYCTI